MARTTSILLIPFLAGFAGAQELGLPLPPPEAPPPVLQGPRADPFAGAWRVEGMDTSSGPYTGEVLITRLPDGSYAYQRRAAGFSGTARPERGRAAPQLTGLILRQDGARSEGLIAELGSAGGSGPALAEGWVQRTGEGLLAGVRRGPAGRGVERWTRLPAARGPNRVELLIDGPEMFPALREALAGARRSISLQTFIFQDDATGRFVAHFLSERARAGLPVRLLVDRAGDRMSKEMKAKLRESGVELIIQHTHMEGLKNSLTGVFRSVGDLFGRLFGKKPAPRERRGLLNHDHRKICVVDGEIAFCGGMNITEEYEVRWHDVHASVRGPAVQELEALFFDRWRAAGGTGQPLPAPRHALRPGEWPAGGVPVDVVGALPGVSTAIKQRYLAEIDGAAEEVNIAMAYFLDDDIIAALKRAQARGAHCTVIIPSDEGHDVPLVRDAFAWSEADVVRSGVELRKFHDRMLHAKVATFDRRCATVGSSNLDAMALTLLAEANLFIPDPVFTAQMNERVFAVDVTRSTRVVPRRQPWYRKLVSGFLHMFRGIL